MSITFNWSLNTLKQRFPLGKIFPMAVYRLWLYICCKTKLKKKLCFFWKNICVIYKIYVICRKKCFYMEENFFYREKYKWKCKKNISHFRNKQTKNKSFLNIYSFCKKKIFLIIKSIFVKTSIKFRKQPIWYSLN